MVGNSDLLDGAAANRFVAGGNVQNVLFEAGRVSDAEIGLEVTTRGGRWADFLQGGPTDILARNNIFKNVTTPYAGDRLNETVILPAEPNTQ